MDLESILSPPGFFDRSKKKLKNGQTQRNYLKHKDKLKLSAKVGKVTTKIVPDKSQNIQGNNSVTQ